MSNDEQKEGHLQRVSFRVSTQIKDDFVEACDKVGSMLSVQLRMMMKEFIRKHKDTE